MRVMEQLTNFVSITLPSKRLNSHSCLFFRQLATTVSFFPSLSLSPLLTAPSELIKRECFRHARISHDLFVIPRQGSHASSFSCKNYRTVTRHFLPHYPIICLASLLLHPILRRGYEPGISTFVSNFGNKGRILTPVQNAPFNSAVSIL